MASLSPVIIQSYTILHTKIHYLSYGEVRDFIYNIFQLILTTFATLQQYI